MNPNQESMPQVAREKYWEEMSIEQKLEQLAIAADHQHRNSQEHQKQLTLLSKHSHNGEGDILVPIKDKEYAIESSRWSPINRQPRYNLGGQSPPLSYTTEKEN